MLHQNFSKVRFGLENKHTDKLDLDIVSQECDPKQDLKRQTMSLNSCFGCILHFLYICSNNAIGSQDVMKFDLEILTSVLLSKILFHFREEI